MGKLDEVKSRIDWLKDLFKILIAIMVADIAGIAKLFMGDKMARDGLGRNIMKLSFPRSPSLLLSSISLF
jgi:hypothetical protein